MSLTYVVALDMCSGALEDMTLCLIWPMVVYVFSHVSQCSFFSFSHLSFPIQTFLSSAAPFTTLQTIPLSPLPLCSPAVSQPVQGPHEAAVQRAKGHQRKSSMCNQLIRCAHFNVYETHLHNYPFPQEPTHSQTPSGSSLNKLQMGEEVRVHMYMQHRDPSCTLWVYPPYTT